MISRLTQKALKTLGMLIKTARRDRRFSQALLAERLAVTRQTISAIEKGDASVAAGTLFEAAYLLGVPLFSQDDQQLSKWQNMLSDFSALLPKKTHVKKQVNNDF